MITLEGVGGNGEVWITWKAPNSGLGLPSGVAAACPNQVGISPVIPTSAYLPPVTNSAFWWSTANSPYGCRVFELEVGYIISTNSSKTNGPNTNSKVDSEWPGAANAVSNYSKLLNLDFSKVTGSRGENNCMQSTITGTGIYTGSRGDSQPMFRYSQAVDGSSGFYTRPGHRVSMAGGRTTTLQEKRSYDHHGTVVGLGLSTSNSALWQTNTMCYPDHIPESTSSTLRPYGYVRHSEFVFWGDFTELFPKSTLAERHTWTHTSANTWVEEWTQVRHLKTGYIPYEPLGPDGYGYVVCSTFRRRVHTLVSVQQTTPGFFQGIFACAESCQYWGHATHGEYYSGVVNGAYQPQITLQVMSPGLCEEDPGDTTTFSQYCDNAAPLARALYTENDMVVARSHAIADVTGLESNWIENLSQVKGTLDVVRPLIEGLAAVRAGSPAQAVKALAGAYLAYKYAIAPTISDVKDVRDNLGTIGSNIISNAYSNETRHGVNNVSIPLADCVASLTYHCTFHLQLKTNAFAVIWNALEKLGLDPSAAHLWDLIPLSFVADWFMDIGSALDTLGQYDSCLLHRNLIDRVQSFKVQWPISGSDLAWVFPAGIVPTGHPVYTWYSRLVSQTFGKVDPFAGQSSSGLSVSQSTQGLALISQYLIKS